MKLVPKISEEKKNALYSMLNTMDLEDKEYLKNTVLKSFQPKNKIK